MFSNQHTSKELLDEYCADLKELQKSTMEYSATPKVARLLQKHHKLPQIAISSRFKASSGNEYIGIILFKGKRDKKMDAYHIGLLSTPIGTCGLLFFTSSQNTLKIKPHFFERYKERLSKIADWQTRNLLHSARSYDEIVKIFLSRNPDIIWIETEVVYRNRLHVFAPVADGVVLLQWDTEREILQANTFITYDMLDETQTRMVGYALQYLALPPEQQAQYGVPKFLK